MSEVAYGSFYMNQKGDLQNDALITFEKHKSIIVHCSLEPEGKFAVTSSDDNHVYLWNTQTGQILFCITEQSTPSLVAFSNDGHYLATASYSGDVSIYRVHKNTEPYGVVQKVINHIVSGISCMCWCRLDNVLLVGSHTGNIFIWYVPFGLSAILPGHSNVCGDIALTRDDRKLYVSFMDRHLQLWNLLKNKLLMEVENDHPMMHQVYIEALACDHNSKLYVSSDFSGAVLFCNKKGPIKTIFAGGLLPCLAFSPSPDLKLLAIGTTPSLITLWDCEQHDVCGMAALNEGISSIIWLDETTMALTTNEGNIYCIDSFTFTHIFKLYGHDSKINQFVYNRRTHTALTVSDDKKAKIFQFPQLYK